MVTVPAWLLQQRRMRAALHDCRPMAPEDAQALILALEGAASASSVDELRTIEQYLGFPEEWRSMKRKIEVAEAISFLVEQGYKGRKGARLVFAMLSAAKRRAKRSGCVPDEESAVVNRLLSATGQCVLSEERLRKLLI